MTPTAAIGVLSVRPEGIPDELKTYRAWVLWKRARVGDKWTKRPHDVHTGSRASSTDSRTWASFDEVMGAYGAGGYDGIGFVFSSGDPFCGVDLDDAVNQETGEVAIWAEQIIAGLDMATQSFPRAVRASTSSCEGNFLGAATAGVPWRCTTRSGFLP